MLDKLKEIIRFARVTLSGKDDGQFPVQQVSFMENTADAFMIFPYGMHANAAADALSVLFSVNGDEQSLAAIATAAKERIKNLEPGEVIFFHPKTKSFTKYANSGNIEIEANGNVNVKANQVNIDAPIVTMSGNLQVAGDITCENLTASTQIAAPSIVVDGVEMKNHKHASGTYAAGGDNVTGNSGNPV